MLLCLSCFFYGQSAVQASEYTTPNQFFAKGTPTFIVGTKGDDTADRLIRGEVEFIRNLLFPGAKIIEDTHVAVEKGVAADLEDCIQELILSYFFFFHNPKH